MWGGGSLTQEHELLVCHPLSTTPELHPSSIDMYNNDVGQEPAQKIIKQTGALKAATQAICLL